MYKPESILENEMNKILWDFEIKMDHLILARRQKMNLLFSGFCHSGGPQIKIKESKKIDKYLSIFLLSFILIWTLLEN